jgi:hypothetical protein
MNQKSPTVLSIVGQFVTILDECADIFACMAFPTLRLHSSSRCKREGGYHRCKPHGTTELLVDEETILPSPSQASHLGNNTMRNSESIIISDMIDLVSKSM